MNEFIWRTVWSPADYLAAVLFVILAVIAGAYTVFDVRDKIDVISQTVVTRDGVQYVEVERRLNGTFRGGYEGELRRLPVGNLVCSTGLISVNYQQYTPDGNLSLLPDPMPLSYWLYGGGCTSKLSEPLLAGEYSMRVCHTVDRPWGWVPFSKRECWEDVRFKVDDQ